MISKKLGLSVLALSVGLASTLSPAWAIDWTGVWSGQAANGRSTEIAISGKKVQYWQSNGQDQPLGRTSVSAQSVSIKHAEGASVTLKPRKDGNADYIWQGNGQSSSVVLSRRWEMAGVPERQPVYLLTSKFFHNHDGRKSRSFRCLPANWWSLLPNAGEAPDRMPA
jgi:hypothetical protein